MVCGWVVSLEAEVHDATKKISIVVNPNGSKVSPRRQREKEKSVSRRRFQTGQLLLKGSIDEKRWYGRWRADVIEDGQVRRHRVQEFLATLKQCPSKRQAMHLLNAKLAAVNSVTHRPGTTSTFRHHAIWFMRDCKQRNRKPIKPSTLSNWRSILDNHLLDVLGDTPLASVGNTAMKDLTTQLVAKKLAAQTIKNITQLAKSVVASAVDRDGIEVFPVKWNAKFCDLPIVDKTKQRRPPFMSGQVRDIVQATWGRGQMFCLLLAAAGLRAGEALGLEVRHFDDASLTIDQAVWNGEVQTPKTANSYRVVDLYPEVADLLKEFIGDRTTGFIFQTSSGRPMTQQNLLHRDLHPALETLGLSKRGFHCFRRFRIMHLRKSGCPQGLSQFWMGWADKGMADRYDRIREDVEYREEVARAMGVGFELPKTLNWTRSLIVDAKSKDQESEEEVLNHSSD
jgi:integrase